MVSDIFVLLVCYALSGWTKEFEAAYHSLEGKRARNKTVSDGDYTVYHFQKTPKMPTYIYALVAGQYHKIEDTYTRGTGTLKYPSHTGRFPLPSIVDSF